MVLVIGFIALLVMALLVSGINHWWLARKNGDPIGSIFYHIAQSKREYDAAKLKRKTEKKSAQVEEVNALSPTARCWQPNFTLGPKKSRKEIDQQKRRETRKQFKSGKANQLSILDEVQFSYWDEKANGNAIRRVSVQSVDAEYIEGFCHKRQAIRTFRLRKISRDITSMETGEVFRKGTWARAMRRLPNNSAVISGRNYRSSRSKLDRPSRKTAVYFVGFRESKRVELEKKAALAGWQIRKAFSPTLNILVTGPLSGSAQIGTAERMNIEIISESDFCQRV
jgi:hypothetical protein